MSTPSSSYLVQIGAMSARARETWAQRVGVLDGLEICMEPESSITKVVSNSLRKARGSSATGSTAV